MAAESYPRLEMDEDGLVSLVDDPGDGMDLTSAFLGHVESDPDVPPGLAGELAHLLGEWRDRSFDYRREVLDCYRRGL